MTGHVLDGEHGAVTIAAATLAQIVVQAAESVDGARVRRPRRGLEVAVSDGGARVELELAARHGAILPALARAVQEAVGDALGRMCGLPGAAVDVSIEEIE